jgi:hypothetical protein
MAQFSRLDVAAVLGQSPSTIGCPAYDCAMLTGTSLIAVTTCNSKSGNAAVGLVILVLLIGAIALFAILNAQARRKLAVANAELAFLRPEYERLRGSWEAGGSGPPTTPMSAGWHPDPTQRHEYRLWDGYTWGDDVADAGVTSKDPMTN